jgi:hypothetical protein
VRSASAAKLVRDPPLPGMGFRFGMALLMRAEEGTCRTGGLL